MHYSTTTFVPMSPEPNLRIRSTHTIAIATQLVIEVRYSIKRGNKDGGKPCLHRRATSVWAYPPPTSSAVRLVQMGAFSVK
ncbi:hypothetical protein BgiBS90_027407, partial [Biomphalaria glabrata]